MKNRSRRWLAGVIILAPAGLFRATDYFISHIESEFFTGYRPTWWRITAIAILLVGYVAIPLLAAWNAKRVLAELAEPKVEIDHYGAVIDEINKEKGA